MKKIIFLLTIIVALRFSSKAQDLLTDGARSTNNLRTGMRTPKRLFLTTTHKTFADNSITKDHAYYIRKSRNLRTTGLVLLAVGVVSSGFGLLVATNSSTFYEDQVSGILFITGAATGIASIPFMIIAYACKNRARVAIDSKKISAGIPFNTGSVNGITLTMNIGS